MSEKAVLLLGGERIRFRTVFPSNIYKPGVLDRRVDALLETAEAIVRLDGDPYAKSKEFQQQMIAEFQRGINAVRSTGFTEEGINNALQKANLPIDCINLPVSQ